MEIVVGIDIAKSTFDASTRAERGWRHRTFANGPEGFEGLLTWASARGRALFCMEATGGYYRALADFLQARGFRVAVLNPSRSAHYARAVGLRNKTDRVDARLLAVYAEREAAPEHRPLRAEVARLRSLLRRREGLARRSAKAKVQLRAPDLDPFVEGTLREEAAFLAAQRKSVEREIAAQVRSCPRLSRSEALLRTIPGVGPVLAWALLAELPDVELLESAKQAAAFVGVCPSERTSGTSVRGRTRLSKSGSRLLRKALYLPALAAMRTCPAFRAFYDRLLGRGKARMAAVGAVMHKLLRVAFGVLKSGSPFTPEKLGPAMPA